MLQFVFFWENVSVAAANSEISVELLDAAPLEEDNSSGFDVDVDACDCCSGAGDPGGVGYPDGFCAPLAWNVLIRFSNPRILGTR